MGEFTEPTDTQSPAAVAEDALAASNGNATASGENRGVKRARVSNAGGASATVAPPDDDDDDDDKPGRERRKIDIKFIQDKSRRHITFSKRKAGIMKKAYELSVLTGTQVLLLVVSETGLVYTFTTPKLQPLVTKSEGKNLIQACLNAPEANSEPQNGAAEAEDATAAAAAVAAVTAGVHAPADDMASAVPPGSAGLPRNGGIPGFPGLTPEQQQQLVYQQYMQQQQQQQQAGSVGGSFAIPPQ